MNIKIILEENNIEVVMTIKDLKISADTLVIIEEAVKSISTRLSTTKEKQEEKKA
jgi:hypothetical protein